MKAYIIIDPQAPDDCDRSIVFALCESDAHHYAYFSLLIDKATIERCSKGDAYIPEGLTEPTRCEDPHVLIACDITPYGWSECEGCGTWGEYDEWGYCDTCEAERMAEEE
jgi:hypothetical protein